MNTATRSTGSSAGALHLRPELASLKRYHLDLSPCRHKLDQNEPPWDIPRRVKQRVAREWVDSDWSRYPDFHADALRAALGELHDWPAEGVLVGNGSNELLALTLRGLARRDQKVLGVEPSFGLYPSFVRQAGARPDFRLCDASLRPPLAEIEDAVREDPSRPVLLCTPNNPTGEAIEPQALRALLARMAGPLLLDNAYGEFCRWDYRPLLRDFPNLILFRTFSKAWGLGSARVGYLLARPELVDELIRVKLPYNLDRASTLAALAVLAEADVTERRVRQLVARRRQWAEMLAGFGLRVYPSEANFLLVRCPGGAAEAESLWRHLEADGIRVRNVGAYPRLDGCLRIGLGGGAALRSVRRALAAFPWMPRAEKGAS